MQSTEEKGWYILSVPKKQGRRRWIFSSMQSKEFIKQIDVSCEDNRQKLNKYNKIFEIFAQQQRFPP